MRNSNPVFSAASKREFADTRVCTYKGVALKTLYYVVMVIIGAALGIYLMIKDPEIGVSFLIGAIFVGFISSLIAMWVPRASKYAGTVYCLCEGMVVGLVSLLLEIAIPGVVGVALISTIACVMVVAVFYLTGLVKVNSAFLRFLLMFSMSLLIGWFIGYILSMFGIINITENFGLSMLSSIVMVFLAVLFLFSDMEQIRIAVEGGMSKEFEWYSSFGLVFTIIWLYIRVLYIVALIMGRVSRR